MTQKILIKKLNLKDTDGSCVDEMRNNDKEQGLENFSQIAHDDKYIYFISRDVLKECLLKFTSNSEAKNDLLSLVVMRYSNLLCEHSDKADSLDTKEVLKFMGINSFDSSSWYLSDLTPQGSSPSEMLWDEILMILDIADKDMTSEIRKITENNWGYVEVADTIIDILYKEFESEISSKESVFNNYLKEKGFRIDKQHICNDKGE